MQGGNISIPWMFDRVSKHKTGEWPEDFVAAPRPGDLLLEEGVFGQENGLLCLTRTGVWITVLAAQIYAEADIPWPGHERADIRGIRITGTTVTKY